ncbi:hypothetical protein Q4561_16115 [Alteromonas sp. 1_MG-2023]|uniref:hypothetical protein n=1 Tax=Alteromonas sp. 1_MG-2023 TaxID=3062669 RepID=UPI0026E43851|nr:hypothetical protein [Alteromonas sp. 1_MG-2023]MDO6568599.1 hypothetical protein [Alteromonas sp. 1_MG-2023]
MNKQKGYTEGLDECESFRDNSFTEIVDRLKKLEKRQPEELKPWYKNASVLVNLLAVFVTLTFTLYNLIQQSEHLNEEESKHKISQLDTAVSTLLQQRLEFFKILLDTPPGPIRDQMDYTINTIRQISLEELKHLVEELGEDVQVNQLLTIGLELSQDSKFEEALNYYELAYKYTDKNDSKYVYIVRSLASILMIPNSPIVDIETSREYWKEAVVNSSLQSDEYSLSVLAKIYLDWGASEALLGNIEEAQLLFANSKETYESMSELNPMRIQGLSRLSSYINSVINKSSILAENNLVGIWTINYDNARKGLMIINQPSHNMPPTVDIEIYDKNSTLETILSGKLSRGSSLGSFKIYWSGISSSYSSFIQTTGTTTLVSDGPQRFTGHEQSLGKLKEKIEVIKVDSITLN